MTVLLQNSGEIHASSMIFIYHMIIPDKGGNYASVHSTRIFIISVCIPKSQKVGDSQGWSETEQGCCSIPNLQCLNLSLLPTLAPI